MGVSHEAVCNFRLVGITGSGYLGLSVMVSLFSAETSVQTV